MNNTTQDPVLGYGWLQKRFSKKFVSKAILGLLSIRNNKGVHFVEVKWFSTQHEENVRSQNVEVYYKSVVLETLPLHSLYLNYVEFVVEYLILSTIINSPLLRFWEPGQGHF